MSPITTHVLDISTGRPAEGVAIEVSREGADGSWKTLGQGVTDSDGRARSLLPEKQRLEAGSYALRFDTGGWFAKKGIAAFYPEVRIVFSVTDASAHHHVPLLLSPFGYSTYRGS